MKLRKRNRLGTVLRRVFGSLVDSQVEATKPLQLFPIEADFTGADSKNPLNCVLARCGKRQTGASNAVILKNYSYLDHPGTDGKPRLFRYVNSKQTRELIARFDRTGKWDVGRPLVLNPVPPTQHRSKMRAYNRRWRRDVAPLYERERKAEQALKVAEADLRKAENRFEAIKDRVPVSAPKYKEAREQLRVAKETKRLAADKLVEAREAVKEYQESSHYHGTGPVRERVFDSRVRNGMAALAQALNKKVA